MYPEGAASFSAYTLLKTTLKLKSLKKNGIGFFPVPFFLYENFHSGYPPARGSPGGGKGPRSPPFGPAKQAVSPRIPCRA